MCRLSVKPYARRAVSPRQISQAWYHKSGDSAACRGRTLLPTGVFLFGRKVFAAVLHIKIVSFSAQSRMSVAPGTGTRPAVRPRSDTCMVQLQHAGRTSTPKARTSSSRRSSPWLAERNSGVHCNILTFPVAMAGSAR